MNANELELTAGTELELTYNGNNGPRTVTVYVVEHDISESLVDEDELDHELIAAEPGARRPRLVRIAISGTDSANLFEVVENGGWGVVKSLNSKSKHGRHLGALEDLEATGETSERFENVAAVRSASVGDVLLVDGDRMTVTETAAGVTVENDEAELRLRYRAAEGAYYTNDEYETVEVSVEATGETNEASDEERALLDRMSGYGHDGESRVVAARIGGEFHALHYRHNADEEGIRFADDGDGHTFKRLRVDPLGLTFDGERVTVDDVELVTVDDLREDGDVDDDESREETGEESEGQASDEDDETESDDESGETCPECGDGGSKELVAEPAAEADGATSAPSYVLRCPACGVEFDDFGSVVSQPEADRGHDDHDDPRGPAPERFAPDGGTRGFVPDGGERPAFEVGEAVDDEQGGGEARVVDPDAGRANAVEVGTTGVTVDEFDGNEDYPDDDRVVEIVFEDYLDSYGATVESVRSGDRDVPTYSYPETRLTRRESEGPEDEGQASDLSEDADERGDAARDGPANGSGVPIAGSPPALDLTEAEYYRAMRFISAAGECGPRTLDTLAFDMAVNEEVAESVLRAAPAEIAPALDDLGGDEVSA